MATPTNLPASFTTGQVLTATNVNDLRGAFRVLQIVEGTYSTLISANSATYVDTQLSAIITPQATSSKVLVIVSQPLYTDAVGQDLNYRLLRGATVIQTLLAAINANIGTGSFLYLDSPSTTSATTYKTQIARGSGSGTVYSSPNGNRATMVLMEISA